jgi:hypothetical protein
VILGVAVGSGLQILVAGPRILMDWSDAWRYLNDRSPSRTRPEITEARATSPTEQNPEICAHDGTEASTADW